MPRPHCCRRIAGSPTVRAFKPVGTPMKQLDVLILGLDELEAIRLADLDGLYQDAAAESMGISRTTFSRLVAGARQKVAEALVDGKALQIEGGVVDFGSSSWHEPGRCRKRGTNREHLEQNFSGDEAVPLDRDGGGCRRRNHDGQCREHGKGMR